MFEAYSEPARRVIFLARYEASRLRSDRIDAQHLLLGFILEDHGVSQSHWHKVFAIEGPEQPLDVAEPEPKESFLDATTAKNLQAEFSTFGPLPESQPTHVDMPLSEKARAALNAAFEHASGGTVTPLHLLWGLLADEGDAMAASLVENGITRERVENAIRIQGASTLRGR